MAFTSRKNLYVHWQELAPIKSQMTERERMWFDLFLKAYYLRSKPALGQLTHFISFDESVRAEVWTEAIWLSNEGRRNQTSDSRAYGSDYTHDDWPGDEEGFSAEDAIIEAIDFKRSQSNGKKNSTVSSTQPKNSRAKNKSTRNTKTDRDDNRIRPGYAPLMASGSEI